MNTSILEIICWPLKILFGYNVRQCYIFEHVLSPVIFSILLGFIPLPWSWVGFAGLAIGHVIIKEFVVDLIKHDEINWPNVVERVYGTGLGALVLWSR